MTSTGRSERKVWIWGTGIHPGNNAYIVERPSHQQMELQTILNSNGMYAISAHKQCGKTTLLLQWKHENKEKFNVFHVDVSFYVMNSLTVFWRQLLYFLVTQFMKEVPALAKYIHNKAGEILSTPFGLDCSAARAMANFRFALVLLKEKTNKKIIILVDEFDILVPHVDIKHSLLAVMRTVVQLEVVSLFAAFGVDFVRGPVNDASTGCMFEDEDEDIQVRKLNADVQQQMQEVGSRFQYAATITLQHLEKQPFKKVFSQFMQDYLPANSTEDNVLIGYDIFNWTNGHPGYIGATCRWLQNYITTNKLEFITAAQWLAAKADYIDALCEGEAKSTLRKLANKEISSFLLANLCRFCVGTTEGTNDPFVRILLSEGILIQSGGKICLASNLTFSLLTSMKHRHGTGVVMTYRPPISGSSIPRLHFAEWIRGIVKYMSLDNLFQESAMSQEGRPSEYTVAYELSCKMNQSLMSSELAKSCRIFVEARKTKIAMSYDLKAVKESNKCRTDILIKNNGETCLIEIGINMKKIDFGEHVAQVLAKKKIHNANYAMLLHFIFSEKELTKEDILELTGSDFELITVGVNSKTKSIAVWQYHPELNNLAELQIREANTSTSEELRVNPQSQGNSFKVLVALGAERIAYKLLLSTSLEGFLHLVNRDTGSKWNLGSLQTNQLRMVYHSNVGDYVIKTAEAWNFAKQDAPLIKLELTETKTER